MAFLLAPVSGVLLAGDVPDAPLDVRVGVGLDEGVDGADDALLVVRRVIGVGALGHEVHRRERVVAGSSRVDGQVTAHAVMVEL